MKSHGPQLLIDILLQNPDGTIALQYQQEGHSFVRQWVDHHYWALRNLAASIKIVAGTTQSVSTTSHISVGANDSTYGIVVGTGTTAVDISNFKLATQIAHGSGAGQLVHAAAGVNTPAVVGNGVQYSAPRAFTNSSGGTITVREVGIYLRVRAIGNFWCGVRDVLVTPVAVNNGQVLTVTYTIVHPT